MNMQHMNLQHGLFANSTRKRGIGRSNKKSS